MNETQTLQGWIAIEPVMLEALARMPAEEFAATMRARLPEGAKVTGVGYDGDIDQYSVIYEVVRPVAAAVPGNA